MPYADPAVKKAYMKAYNDRRGGVQPHLPRNQAKVWNKENPERRKWMGYFAQVLTFTKVTMPSWLAALHFQNYKCACCTKPFDIVVQKPRTDHDHDTGEFRGLLCHFCNILLGQLGDTLPGVKRSYKMFERYLVRR